MTRRSYQGGARLAALDGSITSSITTIVCDDLDGWPDGTEGPGPFYALIDRDVVGSEEKVLCSGRAGNTLTVITRGADGTTARSHTGGATIEHIHAAVDSDEANEHVNTGQGVHGLDNGDPVAGETTTATLTNKTIDGTTNTVQNVAQASITGLVADQATQDGRLDVVEADTATNAADIGTNAAGIAQEIVDRAAADATLQSNIDAEASTRGSADTTLQSNIDAEEAARIAADGVLQTNIDAEEAARIAADAAHVAAADPHTQYAPNEANQYVKGWVKSLTFNGTGAASFTHGENSTPIAVVANALLGSQRVTVHPGATSGSVINLKAFNSDSTVYVGNLSQVHIIATFAAARPT